MSGCMGVWDLWKKINKTLSRDYWSAADQKKNPFHAPVKGYLKRQHLVFNSASHHEPLNADLVQLPQPVDAINGLVLYRGIPTYPEEQPGREGSDIGTILLLRYWTRVTTEGQGWWKSTTRHRYQFRLDYYPASGHSWNIEISRAII